MLLYNWIQNHSLVMQFIAWEFELIKYEPFSICVQKQCLSSIMRNVGNLSCRWHGIVVLPIFQSKWSHVNEVLSYYGSQCLPVSCWLCYYVLERRKKWMTIHEYRGEIWSAQQSSNSCYFSLARVSVMTDSYPNSHYAGYVWIPYTRSVRKVSNLFVLCKSSGF